VYRKYFVIVILRWFHCSIAVTVIRCGGTDLYIYVLDAISIHVISNHVDTDKLTTANGGTFTSSSASLGSQSRQSTSVTDRACCNVIGY